MGWKGRERWRREVFWRLRCGSGFQCQEIDVLGTAAPFASLPLNRDGSR